MKFLRFFLAVLLVSSFFLTCEQNTVQEKIQPLPYTVDDSEVPDSMQTLLWTAANRIAYQNIWADSTTYMDSVLIPSDLAQPFYFALVNVYLESTLASRDSIFETVKFYMMPDDDLKTMLIQVSTDQPWTSDWILHNGMTTGITTLDSLVDLCGFYLKSYHDLREYGINEYMFYLASDSILNISALTQLLGGLDEIIYAESAIWVIDGDFIQGTQLADAIEITFDKGWGDCPAGCISRHQWRFSVNLDGVVQFLGSSGDPI